MATAEFAVALPAVALVLALVVSVMQLLLTHQRVWHAASVGTRVAARGEVDGAVVSAARTGMTASQVQVSRAGGWVTVRVAAAPPALLAWAVDGVAASATAPIERADPGGSNDPGDPGGSGGPGGPGKSAGSPPAPVTADEARALPEGGRRP